MGRPIEIAIDAKTKDAETGINNVTDSLDDAATSAEDLGTTTRKAGDKVEDALKDASKQADVLDRDLTKALDDGAASARTTGDAISSNVRRGADDASEGIDTLKANTASNAKEMGASFQDVGSAIDALQGLAAEALEGFGPAGIAAGVAMAAGIGIAQQQLQAAADKVNELKEKAGELAVAYADATDTERWQALNDQVDELSTTITDAKSWWEVWQKDARTGIEDVAAGINAGLISAEQFNQVAYTTDVRQRAALLGDVIDNLNKKIDHNNDAVTNANSPLQAYAGALGLAADKTEVLVDDVMKQTKVAEGVRNVLQGWKDAADAQVKILAAQATAAGLTTDAFVAQQQAVAAAQEAQQSYADALAGIADPIGVYEQLLADKTTAEQIAAQATADATADTTDSWETYAKAVEVSINDLIAEWNRQADEAKAFEDNLAIIGAAGGQALADELRAKGPEVAGAVADVIAHASPSEQAAAIAAHAGATGNAVAAGIARGITDSSGKVTAATQQAVSTAAGAVSVPQIVYGANIGGLQEAVDREATKLRPPQITIDALVRLGKKGLI
jgi:hypothetical protein